ncbi:MAG: hypothetical protein AB8B61_02240, partial [Cyclobacteriaceae bacterium]
MKHLSIVGLLFLTTLSTGQQFGVNAPRSRSGIGDYFSNGYSRSRAMGISISSANKLFINNTNPALLPRTKYTTFEAGIENQYRALATSSAKQTSSDAIPAYFAISLPISKKWKSAVSLNPYTYANYSTAVTTETGTTTYSGSGGVNQFTFSNGVEATSNLSFGLNISYLFGKEKDNIATQVTDSSNYNLTRNESFYSGFQFKPGIAFRKELRKVTIPTRGKLVITNKNYRSKKDLIEICLDSLTVIDSLGKKERIALCKESVRLLDKKLIFEDTLTNQESFFAKKYIASVNKTTLNGNYFMLIPSYSEVIYDSEIPFSRKSKIKKYLKGINTKGYGVLVKA